jgi:hypothetical protein
MAEPMTPYIVRQGDYLAKLAFIHGFDADTVWNDAKNDDIRKLRPNPNILAPGDILYIPESKKDELPIEKGTENSYAASVPRVTVVLVFQDPDGAPIASEVYEVRGLPPRDSEPLKTQSDGRAEFTIPLDVRQIEVFFPTKNILFAIRVGDLDPHLERSGIIQRLRNLGLLRERVAARLGSGVGSPDDQDDLRNALATLQAASGADATGTLSEETRRLVVDKFGA